MSNELENKLDQIKGKLKETAGKLTDSETLELKGKVDNIAARLAETASNTGNEIKEKAASELNDLLDTLEKKLDIAKNKDKK
ncbi:CsbD family protein [Clostridium sp. C105KSO13]|uniref:CsbD family protein n=1 Tax=Clostridium sp. C105KSO13 TaxID=1776045 RepID=UPI0007407AB1|nr:CsbD family protein [Clostridium sp. C105KSO13]CUX15099.1 CsbD-like protein [Clostridium sp. C105KSO13]